MPQWVSKRALSAKERGRKGGLATSRTHDEEFKEQRSAKAGSTTRDRYGIDFYRYLRTLTPKHKSTKEKVKEVISPIVDTPETLDVSNSLTLMQAVAKSIS